MRLFEDAVEVGDGVLPQMKRATRSSCRCLEQATSWLRSLGWIEETVGPLEDRGKRWVAARMSGCVQREQALAQTDWEYRADRLQSLEMIEAALGGLSR